MKQETPVMVCGIHVLNTFTDRTTDLLHSSTSTTFFVAKNSSSKNSLNSCTR